MRFFLLLVFGLILISESNAQQSYDPKSLVVKFNKSLPEPVSSFVDRNGTWEVLIPERNLYAFTWSSGEPASVVKERLYKTFEGVEFVTYNFKSTQRSNEPNDPSFSLQWHHKVIQSAAAWVNQTGGLTYLGDTIVVAVLEKNNIDFTHDDLQGTIRYNHGEIPGNMIDDDGNGYVDDYAGLNAKTSMNNNVSSGNHATRIGGLIGATGNNCIGVAGINWQVKILSVSEADYISDILKAFRYVLTERRRYNQSDGSVGSFVVAVNASFGFDKTKPNDDPVFSEWCDLIDELGKEGILTVGATANSRWDVDFVGDMPTNCTSPYMIGVTATTRLDTLDKAAAYGMNSIDLGAPGEALFSTRTGNTYNTESGTSYAAPLVAGAVALLYAMPDADFSMLSREKPAEAASVIREAILDGVDPLSSLQGRTVTGGRLNLFKSIESFSKLGYGVLPDKLMLLKVFPNPVNEQLNYAFQFDGNEEHEVLIADLLGRIWLVARIPMVFYPQESHQLDVSNLPAGVYLLQVRNGKKQDSVRFIKGDKQR